MYETRDQFIAAFLFYVEVPYIGISYTQEPKQRSDGSTMVRNTVHFQFEERMLCESWVEGYLGGTVEVNLLDYVACLEKTKRIYKSIR